MAVDCCSEDATQIFSSGAGKVVAVDGIAAPVYLAVDGSTDTIHNLKAIVTSVGYQAQSGFQFMHALREFIYVYVFTERMGEIVLSGLAFPASCDPLGPQDDNDTNLVFGATGMERVLTWHESNRITTRAAPITIAFGTDVSYDAFLTSLKVDIANAETGVAQFSMHFNYLPIISDDDDMCFSIDESCLDIPCVDGDELEEYNKRKLYGWGD